MEPTAPKETLVVRCSRVIQSGAIGGLLAIPLVSIILGPGAFSILFVNALPLIPVGLVASFLLRNARPNRALGGALFFLLLAVIFWAIPFVPAR